LREDLQRIRTRIAAFNRDNGIRWMGIPPTTIKRGGEQSPTPPGPNLERDRLAGSLTPRRAGSGKAAVARALQRLCRWKGYSQDRLPPVHDDSDWTMLAAMLYGDWRQFTAVPGVGSARIYGHVRIL
jgi:hypothetical protein